MYGIDWEFVSTMLVIVGFIGTGVVWTVKKWVHSLIDGRVNAKIDKLVEESDARLDDLKDDFREINRSFIEMTSTLYGHLHELSSKVKDSGDRDD